MCTLDAVKKIEQADWKRIRRLYVSKENAPLFGGLCKKLAGVHGIYNVVSDEDLFRLSGTRHHQGVLAFIYAPRIPPLDDETFTSWITNHELVIILDDVSNVHNVGAVVRSAAFFGLRNFIVEEANINSVINTSAYRVAKGAMECVRFFSVPSIESFLESVRGRILSAASDLEATETIFELREIRENRALLLVLGNEETGVRKTVKKNCDKNFVIPALPITQKDGKIKPCVQSLNVAQAASIMFYELTKAK